MSFGFHKMSKRDFVRLVAGASYLTVSGRYLTGCKIKDRELSASEINFLNIQGGFRCSGSPERAASVQADFMGVVHDANDEQRALTFSQMALLPDATLAFLKSCIPSGFNIRFVSSISGYEGAVGLCMGGMDGGRPQWVQLQHNAASLNYVVLHELGHATHTFTEERSGLSDARAMLEKTYQEVSGSAERQSMWSYAMKNNRELFACANSSFYCSEQSRADMQSKFPLTWAYFSQVFIPPPGSGPIPGNTTQPIGQPPFIQPPVVSPPIINQPQMNNIPVNQQVNLLPILMLIFKLFFNKNNSYGGYSLAGEGPSLVLPTNRQEIYPGQEMFIELKPGTADFSDRDREDFKVSLFLKGQQQHRRINLAARFTDRMYIADGNIMANVRVPMRSELERLAGGALFDKSANATSGVAFGLQVRTGNNAVIGEVDLKLNRRHVDFTPSAPRPSHG